MSDSKDYPAFLYPYFSPEPIERLDAKSFQGTCLFAFVEEFDYRIEPEKGKPAGQSDMTLSGVDAFRFVDIEAEIPDCPLDATNAQRAQRKQLLNQFYSDEGGIWNLHASIDDVRLINWLATTFRPSTWHTIEIDMPGNRGIRVYRELPGPIAEWRDVGRVTAIGPVHPYYLLRLEEIFSLNHLPDEDFGTEDNGDPLQLSPSPFTPLIPEVDLPREFVIPELDDEPAKSTTLIHNMTRKGDT